MAIGKVAEVQLHARLEAPLQRDLVDRDGPLLLPELAVHGGVEVVRRIEVRSVVRRQLHRLHGPALAIGQVLALQAGEERLHLRERGVVREVLDLRRERRRIRNHVVLQVDRKVDEVARHGKTSVGAPGKPMLICPA
jgi:hypothetical protein